MSIYLPSIEQDPLPQANIIKASHSDQFFISLLPEGRWYRTPRIISSRFQEQLLLINHPAQSYPQPYLSNELLWTLCRFQYILAILRSSYQV